MRLFIAINFTTEIKNKLLAISDELRAVSSRGKFSLPENMHLTLAFIGECDAKPTTVIKNAMDAIAFNPFDLTIDSVGRFKRSGGDLWWAGVSGENALIELQQNITDKLIENKLVLKTLKYIPHITFGREIVTKSQPHQIEPFGETVKKIELMQSQRINNKLIYTTIHTKEAEDSGF